MYFQFISSSDPELKDRIVLSPQFLVNALKSLITAEMFFKKKAEIRDKLGELRCKGILRPSLIGIRLFSFMYLESEIKILMGNLSSIYITSQVDYDLFYSFYTYYVLVTDEFV